MENETGESSPARDDEIERLVAIIVRRLEVWEKGVLDFTAEEHGVWLRTVRRHRREIDPLLTDEQCFELVLEEFLVRHRREPRLRVTCASV